MPMSVAMMPSFGSLTLASRPSIAFAPSSPIRPCSCADELAAHRLVAEEQPATEITIRSSGAIENSV